MATPDKSSANVYTYEGKNKRGEIVLGEVTATTLALAKASLRKQGITADKIRKKTKPLLGQRQKSIKPADICIFSRQMATMMSAGIPLVQSFDIVGRGHPNPVWET